MMAWLVENYIELLGVFFSLLYLWFSIRQRILLWPVGIISALMYIIVFFQSKFYADMSLNAYYFFISIYGWIHWSRSNENGNYLPVIRIRRTTIIILFFVFLVLFFSIGMILHRFTDSPIPYWDAFTTAASIIATWMLTKKMLEHWIIWIVVDLVSMLLYVYRGLYPTAMLFIVYTTMAVVGYIQWKKSIDQKKSNLET